MNQSKLGAKFWEISMVRNHVDCYYFGLYLCFMIVLKGFAIKVATLTFADTSDKDNQYNPHDLGYGNSLCAK